MTTNRMISIEASGDDRCGKAGRPLAPWKAGLVLALALPGSALADPLPSHTFDLVVTPTVSGVVRLVTPLCDGLGSSTTCQTAADAAGPDMASVISQYGPRRLSSQGATIETDFHRGIDISLPVMAADSQQSPKGPAVEPDHSTRVYAVRAGTIHSIEYSLDDFDPTKKDGYRVIVKHDGSNKDDNGRPFYTVYKHMWAVQATATQGGASIPNLANGSAVVADCGGSAVTLYPGAAVTTGQFLGCTGFTANGSHELHFEARVAQRNANLSYSLRNYNRFAVNPLRLFKVADDVGGIPGVVTGELQSLGTLGVSFEVRGGIAPLRLDFHQYIADSSFYPNAPYAAVDAHNYHVVFDTVELERLNYEYTHETTAEGASCPFAAVHPANGVKADTHFKDGEVANVRFDEPTDGSDADSDGYVRDFILLDFPEFQNACTNPASDVTDVTYVLNTVYGPIPTLNECW